MRILFLLFITVSLLISCKKSEIPPPAIVYISGRVTGAQSNSSIGFVDVTLLRAKHELFSASTASQEFTTEFNGEYTYHFTAEEGYDYKLRFSKNSFNSKDFFVDKNKQYQVIDVEL